MTAPSKPWEAAGVNFRSDAPPLSLQSSSKVPDVNVRTMPSAPPPLPPRPTTLSARRITSNAGIVGGSPMYRGYPSNTGYMGGYGGLGGYGNYGMYGSGYGGYGTAYSGYPYGYQNTNDNRLVALAEERTRPAFESIESVVRAFGSVSFMLESTLGALHASFRAALGVADHLGQLRNILSALSVFRLLRWCARQLHRLFGRRHQGASFGGAWGEAAKLGDQVVADSAPSSSAPSQWPLQAFIGVVISGSYLAWRLLSYIVGPGGPESLSPFKGEEGELWVQGRDPGCQLAVACYNFTATMDQELSFSAGDRLIVAPKSRQPVDSRDWLLAVHLRPARQAQQSPPPVVKVGLVPSNYVRMVERRTRQGVYQVPGAVVAQGPMVPLAAQPPGIPGLPLPATHPTMAYGQPIMAVPPPTTIPHPGSPTMQPPDPSVVDPLPLDVQATQPLDNGAAAGGGDSAPVAVSQAPESESSSKAVDGGQDT